MRSCCVAAVLLCGAPHVAAQLAWNSTGGAACENASLAEFSSCVADCHGSCDPSLFAACDVQFPEGSESLRRFTEPAANRLHPAGADTRWAKASRRHSATCARFIFCEQLLLDIGESSECCGDGECAGDAAMEIYLPGRRFPVGACTTGCARSYYMEFAQECLHEGFLSNNTVVYGQMITTEATCRDGLLRAGAEAFYEANSSVAYVPYGALLLFLLPFAFFSIFIFFGRQLATLFRMLIGGCAMGFFVAWPSIAPYFGGCGIALEGVDVVASCADAPPISPELVVALALAVAVFFQAAFACRQLTNFGNAVQGFSLGIIGVVLILDVLMGGHAQTGDTGWLLLGMYGSLGTAGCLLNVFLPSTINTVASTSIGTYVCCQIFCLVGYFENWFFTFPVSLMAASMGLSGCTTGGCWMYLVCWVGLGVLGCYTQMVSIETESKVDDGDHHGHGFMDRVIYMAHQAMDLFLDMETSMKEHAEFHTKEEMQELADHHAATWAKVATFMSDTCLMIFGLSLFIGMLELWLRGVDFPAFLGLYIVASSLVAILFTLYEMRIHNTATVAARVRQFDIYIWGIFVLIPVSVTGFLMCMSLGLDSDPLGLHDDFVVDALATECAGETCADPRTIFQRHMQAAAFSYMGLTVSACMTSTYVSKHLGGVLYLALKVTKFVAILMIGYGGMLIYIGVILVPPEGEDSFQAGGMYTFLFFIGGLMTLTGLMGICGAYSHHKQGNEARAKQDVANSTADNDDDGDTPAWMATAEEEAEVKKQVKMLKLFCISICFIMALNAAVFVLAGIWAADVETMSDSEWEVINGTGGPLATYCLSVGDVDERGDPSPGCMPTRQEFVHSITSAFQLLMAVGITAIVYMALGLAAGVFVMMQDPGALSHAEELVAKHAKGYLDHITASELRAKHGKEHGLKKVEAVQGVRQHHKKRVRVKKKKDPERERRRREKKERKKRQAEGKPSSEMDNPLAEGAGATFDVEDSSAVATNTSGVVSVPSRSTNPDSSDSDSGSSEYEWHTTDEESGGEDNAADGAAPNGAAAPPNGLTPQKSDDM